MIADRNLCLGDLIGVIRTFFHKIGITQVMSCSLREREQQYRGSLGIVK